MRRQTLSHFLALSLLAAFLTPPATPAQTQERKVRSDHVPAIPACPSPIVNQTLTATTPNVLNAAFTPVQLGGPRAWLNDPASDKHFIFSFPVTKGQRCCQITKAVLTVKMTSNQGGQSATSNDAGNDHITLMHAGAVVAPYHEAVYSGVPKPFPAGTTVTKTWNLQAALSKINASDSADFLVQDDTQVNSATLQLWGCCLGGSGKDATEQGVAAETQRQN